MACRHHDSGRIRCGCPRRCRVRSGRSVSGLFRGIFHGVLRSQDPGAPRFFHDLLDRDHVLKFQIKLCGLSRGKLEPVIDDVRPVRACAAVQKDLLPASARNDCRSVLVKLVTL